MSLNKIFTLIIGLMVLVACHTETSIIDEPEKNESQKPDNEDFGIALGVNLISEGNQYHTTGYNDQNLDALFLLLQQNHFKQVSVRVIWKIMEPTSGQYNKSAIDHLKRIMTKANMYGLSVMLDFHTLFNSGDQKWQAPDWLKDIAPEISVDGRVVAAGTLTQIFYTDVVRERYADMMKHVVVQLGIQPALKYISMMNEPYLYWKSSANSEHFDQTITYLAEQLRLVTDRPLSVRFLSSWNPWADDPKKRIGINSWKSLDYIGMNQYFSMDEDEEKDGTVLWPMAHRAVDEVQKAGKIFIVTECGYLKGSLAEYEYRWKQLFETKFQNYKPNIIQIWNGENDGVYFNDNTGGFNILKAQNQFADYVITSIVPNLD